MEDIMYLPRGFKGMTYVRLHMCKRTSDGEVQPNLSRLLSDRLSRSGGNLSLRKLCLCLKATRTLVQI